MQRLIDDLLSYSRVGRKGAELEPLDSSSSSRARSPICRAHLRKRRPDRCGDCRVTGARSLAIVPKPVANAIKFRRDGVAAHLDRRRARRWHVAFAVATTELASSGDVERVFLIFQRLHSATNTPAPGSGSPSPRR